MSSPPWVSILKDSEGSEDRRVGDHLGGGAMSNRERLYLYDTTLRDGAQTQGVDFSLEDKGLIAQQLDVLGLDYIEAGYPGANPTDTKLFSAKTRSLARRNSPPSA